MSFDKEHYRQEAISELAPTEDQINARISEKVHARRDYLQNELNQLDAIREEIKEIDDYFTSQQVG